MGQELNLKFVPVRFFSSMPPISKCLVTGNKPKLSPFAFGSYHFNKLNITSFCRLKLLWKYWDPKPPISSAVNALTKIKGACRYCPMPEVFCQHYDGGCTEASVTGKTRICPCWLTYTQVIIVAGKYGKQLHFYFYQEAFQQRLVFFCFSDLMFSSNRIVVGSIVKFKGRTTLLSDLNRYSALNR